MKKYRLTYSFDMEPDKTDVASYIHDEVTGLLSQLQAEGHLKNPTLIYVEAGEALNRDI